MRLLFPLTRIPEYLGLPGSTYYYHAAHPKKDRLAEARKAVREAFGESGGAYGYRRVAWALERDFGMHLNRKTVAKIMREEGLAAKGRRKRAYSSYRGSVGRVAPNVLRRDFSADRPIAKLVSDVTRFNVGDKKVYLSPLIDLYNGEVVSWRIGRSPNMEMALGMLDDAAGRLAGSGAIIHTDQGFQYQNARWQRRLADLGCIQSMSRKGNCLDNACAESFFGQLKREFSDGSDYTQAGRFMRDLDNWIRWYNARRIRGSLCGMAPLEYRLMHNQTT